MKIAPIAAAAALIAVQAVAQQPAAPPPPPQPDFSKAEVKVTDLGNRTFMLEGVGGNITAAAGDDAVIMIDAQFAPMHDKIKAAVDGATRLPIRYVVNTHFHGDHTGGNAGFANDGAMITAQANVRARLAAGTTNGLTGGKTAPVIGAGLPTNVYTDEMTVKIAGRTADLKHAPNAHTDGDTYVYWTEANVLSTGDTFSTGRYPNIDFANGGNIKGMIEASDRYLQLVNDQTKIVPGHGFLATKADLVNYRAMLVDARDRMAKLIAEGKNEADVIAARPFADYDKKLGVNDQASQNFIRVVYHSLKPRAPAERLALQRNTSAVSTRQDRRPRRVYRRAALRRPGGRSSPCGAGGSRRHHCALAKFIAVRARFRPFLFA